MQDLLDQIKLSLDANLYYCSLFLSLSIPDICAALMTNKGETNKVEYIKWFDTHIAKPKDYRFLMGEDCYYFRCSMLHQGTTQHRNSSFERILFIEPGATSNIAHNCIFGGAYVFDVRILCNDVIEAARTWFDQNKTDANVKKNYAKFIRRHKNGISPHIVGVPVIG